MNRSGFHPDKVEIASKKSIKQELESHGRKARGQIAEHAYADCPGEEEEAAPLESGGGERAACRGGEGLEDM
jgi:hypothetical protein